MFQFESIRWANPEMWWLLLAPLVLAPAWIYYELFHRRVRRTFPGQTLVSSMISGSGFGRRLAAFLCAVVALELLAVSAMGPRYGLKDYSVKGIGVDVALVLDASRSMKVPDVTPDRIGSSIIEISRLLEGAAGNRVALVPFAGISFIQSPLTTDLGVIRQYLNDLRVTDIPVPGTALGRALATAGRALGVDSSDMRGSGHKAIIVFTDGENHEGEPVKVAEKLAKQGVRIFTVGVGTPEGKPIPVLDDRGVVTGLTRAEDGVSPVISKLNESLLKDLAEKTGGRYFALAPGMTATDVSTGLLNELKSLEKAEYMTAVEKLLEDRYQYPLAAALLFMLMPFLWLGGGGFTIRKKTGAAAAAFLVLSIGWTPARAAPFEHPALATIFNTSQSGVEKARKMMEQGEHGEALKKLKELSQTLPPSPALDLNLAMASYGTGDYGAAAEYADSAIRKNDALKPGSPMKLDQAALLHAYGTILAEKARKMSVEKANPRQVRAVYRQAVDSLVAALVLNPDNADTIRNVEIVAAAAYPPCSSLDDPREPNNTLPDAAFLTPDPNSLQFSEQMLLCPKNDDWFKLPLNPGETIFVSVEKPKDESASPDQPPQPAEVDLSMQNENGDVTAAAARQARMSAPADSGTTAIMHITGPEVEDGVDYVLNARIVPPCPSGDDQMEPNDTADTLKPVQDGDLSLRICPLNDDWFEYTEKQGTSKEVRLTSANSDDPVELQVFTADGAPMDVRTEIGIDQTVKSVILPKAEQDAAFRIMVSAGGGQGFYNLSIKDPEGGDNQDQNQDQNQDENRDKPQNQEQQQQGSRTMREMIESLDSNDENIEAQEAARNNPLGDSRPDKDW